MRGFPNPAPVLSALMRQIVDLVNGKVAVHTGAGASRPSSAPAGRVAAVAVIAVRRTDLHRLLLELLIAGCRLTWVPLKWYPLRLARSALAGAPLDGRGRKFNLPAKAAGLRHAEPRSEDAARQ